MSVRRTALTVQREAEQRRVTESHLREIKETVDRQSILAANSKSEVRVEAMRRDRVQQQTMAELYQDLVIEQQQAEMQRKTVLADQEARLAAELLRRKDEESKQNAITKKIVESSDELKKLEAKLKAAYVTRDRALQKMGTELNKEKEKQEDIKLLAEMEARRLKDLARDEKENKERAEKNFHSRMVLERQIEEREMERKKAYEEFASQKAEVEGVIAVLREQDAKERAEKERKRQETKDFISKYLEDRKRWKIEEAQKEKEEMAQIEAWNQKQQDRITLLKEQKKAAASNQDAILAKISADIEANRKQREETEQLLLELFLEEKEAKLAEEESHRADKKEKLKKEMMQANEQQKQYKRIKEEEEKAEEDRFRVQLMEKFAENERIEQMSVAKKRERQMAHRKEVERILVERREAEARKKEIEAQEFADQQLLERYRKTVIEKERQRLLLEHAHQLREFLPPGVFKSLEDVELVFGKDYVEKYGAGLVATKKS